MYNIILIGITGVGKTTIGKLIAEKLNKKFVDLDKNIELNCGVDIQRIFSIEGERGFRLRETNELKKMLYELSCCVISLGGGCVLEKINRDLILQNKSYIVQLTANSTALSQRLNASYKRRPMFNDMNDIKKQLNNIQQERVVLYDSLSHIKLDTSQMKPNQVVGLIVNDYNRFIL